MNEKHKTLLLAMVISAILIVLPDVFLLHSLWSFQQDVQQKIGRILGENSAWEEEFMMVVIELIFSSIIWFFILTVILFFVIDWINDWIKRRRRKYRSSEF